jgi:SAM-dependent methyltransferase
MTSILCKEEDRVVDDLERRLSTFYATAEGYTSFTEPTAKEEFWDPIRANVEARLSGGGQVALLEFGAGKTGFGQFLGPLRTRVRFEAQDITDRHRDWLVSQADVVHFGDLCDVEGPFDVIFSTFVWEHVCRPAQTYQHLLRHLAPGGSLFIISPRYDFPLYTPPSARHYPRWKRGLVNGLALMQRLRGAVLGRPAYIIHAEPAVLVTQWFRDADAVHWVSLRDFCCAAPKGFSVNRHTIRRTGLMGKFWARFCLAFVEIQRPCSDTARPKGHQSRSL